MHATENIVTRHLAELTAMFTRPKSELLVGIATTEPDIVEVIGPLLDCWQPLLWRLVIVNNQQSDLTRLANCQLVLIDAPALATGRLTGSGVAQLLWHRHQYRGVLASLRPGGDERFTQLHFDHLPEMRADIAAAQEFVTFMNGLIQNEVRP